MRYKNNALTTASAIGNRLNKNMNTFMRVVPLKENAPPSMVTNCKPIITHTAMNNA